MFACGLTLGVCASVGVVVSTPHPHRSDLQKAALDSVAVQTNALLLTGATVARFADSALEHADIATVATLLAGMSRDRLLAWRIVVADRAGRVLLDTEPAFADGTAAPLRLVAVAAEDIAPSRSGVWRRPSDPVLLRSNDAGMAQMVVAVGTTVADLADRPDQPNLGQAAWGRTIYAIARGPDAPHVSRAVGQTFLVADDGTIIAAPGSDLPVASTSWITDAWRSQRMAGGATAIDGVTQQARPDGEHRLLVRHLDGWPASVLVDAGPQTNPAWWPAAVPAVLLALAASCAWLVVFGWARLTHPRWTTASRSPAAAAQPWRADHDAMARRLLGQVAHELNNALTTLSFDAEVMASTHPRDAGLGLLSRSMLNATQRCSMVTNALLAYARRAALNPRLLDLAAELRARQPAFAAALHMGQSLVCVGFDRDPVFAMMDPDGLYEAVLALVRNAAEAAGPRAEICLELQRVPGDLGMELMITVDDVGPGMDPATLLRALEPGFSGKTSGRHLGLGLPSAAGFALQSGGRLALDSKPGLGTRASIIVPQDSRLDSAISAVAPETGADVLAEMMHGGPVGSAGGNPSRACVRVLLVDDSAAVRESVARRLRADGYDVIEARTVADAEMIVAAGVDVLLTDIVLDDDVDGFTLAKRAREMDPTLPLVFMSGYMSSRHPALLAGDELASFVRKPVNGAELHMVLAGLIAVRDGRRGKAAISVA